MGIMRPVFLSRKNVTDNGSTDIDLPRSTVFKELYLDFTFDVTIGTSNATLHEDGLAAWLSRIQLIAQGIPSIFDCSGFAAKLLAQYAAGSTLFADVAPVVVGANVQMKLRIPISFLLRDAVNEFYTLFDSRGLPELKVRLDTRAFATTPFTPGGGGGTVVLNSAVVDVSADIWDTPQQVAGVTMEKRISTIGATQSTTGPKGQQQFDLLKGGLFRGGLLIARTAAAPGGARTDARVTGVSIRRNQSDMIVDSVPWSTLQLRQTFEGTFGQQTGVLYLSLDPEGAMQRDGMIDTARVPGAQESLVLETEIGTANVVWEFIPEYLIVRGA
jgi:hypothetical protein